MRYDVGLSLFKLGMAALLVSLLMLEWRLALAAVGVMAVAMAATFGPVVIDLLYFERRLRWLEKHGTADQIERFRVRYTTRLERGLAHLRNSGAGQG